MDNWKKFILKYFDINQNGKIEWYEYIIPLLILFLFQLSIEILANLITK